MVYGHVHVHVHADVDVDVHVHVHEHEHVHVHGSTWSLQHPGGAIRGSMSVMRPRPQCGAICEPAARWLSCAVSSVQPDAAHE